MDTYILVEAKRYDVMQLSSRLASIPFFKERIEFALMNELNTITISSDYVDVFKILNVSHYKKILESIIRRIYRPKNRTSCSQQLSKLKESLDYFQYPLDVYNALVAKYKQKQYITDANNYFEKLLIDKTFMFKDITSLMNKRFFKRHEKRFDYKTINKNIHKHDLKNMPIDMMIRHFPLTNIIYTILRKKHDYNISSVESNLQTICEYSSDLTRLANIWDKYSMYRIIIMGNRHLTSRFIHARLQDMLAINTNSRISPAFNINKKIIHLIYMLNLQINFVINCVNAPIKYIIARPAIFDYSYLHWKKLPVEFYNNFKVEPSKVNDLYLNNELTETFINNHIDYIKHFNPCNSRLSNDFIKLHCMKIDPCYIYTWCLTDDVADYLFSIKDLPFKVGRSPYLSVAIYNKYKALITPMYDILTKYNILWLDIGNIYQNIHDASESHDPNENTYIAEANCKDLPSDFYDKYLYLLPFLDDIPLCIYVKYGIKCMFEKMLVGV